MSVHAPRLLLVRVLAAQRLDAQQREPYVVSEPTSNSSTFPCACSREDEQTRRQMSTFPLPALAASSA
jgi:hypothetical protein